MRTPRIQLASSIPPTLAPWALDLEATLGGEAGLGSSMTNLKLHHIPAARDGTMRGVSEHERKSKTCLIRELNGPQSVDEIGLEIGAIAPVDLSRRQVGVTSF